MTIPQVLKNSSMTQKELSLELRVSQATISMWQRGRMEPRLKHLSKISRLFNVSLDSIAESYVT